MPFLIRSTDVGRPCRSFIELDLPLLIDSTFAAGAAMISFGAVLGKVTPAQITWLLVLQVPIYAFNAHLVTEASLFTSICSLHRLAQIFLSCAFLNSRLRSVEPHKSGRYLPQHTQTTSECMSEEVGHVSVS